MLGRVPTDGRRRRWVTGRARTRSTTASRWWPRRWRTAAGPRSSMCSARGNARWRNWPPRSGRAWPTPPSTCGSWPTPGWCAPAATATGSSTRSPAPRWGSCGPRCGRSPPTTSRRSTGWPPPTSATAPVWIPSAATSWPAGCAPARSSSSTCGRSPSTGPDTSSAPARSRSPPGRRLPRVGRGRPAHRSRLATAASSLSAPRRRPKEGGVSIETDHLIPLVDEGLGNSAYLLDLGDGRALAVDPARDLRAPHAAATRRGLRVAYAADTHLHADFLTAAGRRRFPHRGLGDGDAVDLGGLTLQAIATPGHTDEHLSFLLRDGATPVGVFTGGSLIVGSAARTDLLGPDRTQELARAQYASLHRLAALPDATAVWPTHGAGSFCSAPRGGDRTSTIGQEKATNPLLAAPDEDAFVDRLLAGLGSFPSYFLRLPEENRRGPAVVGDPLVPGLDAASVAKLVQLGAVVIDVRPVPDFAAGHIPGALSIHLRPQFVSWLGWLLDPGTPYVIVRGPGQDISEVVWQALKIGYDVPAGELSGGMAAWDAHTARIPLLSASDIGDSRVLDVRQDNEFHSGHIPGAVHVEL